MPNSRKAGNKLSRELFEERWYCIHTAPGREATAADYLNSKNVQVFNPILPAHSSGAGKKRRQPLFPRYFFARFALNRGFDAVRYGQGISRIVSDMDGPLPVPDEVIEQIQLRLATGFYSRTSLESGERIVVESGAFKGITGIFHAYAAGHERVRLLMELMNRSVVVELDRREVKKWRRQSAGGSWQKRAS